MTLQYKEALRDEWLNTFVAEIGAAPKLKFFGNDQPADCDEADSAELIATLTLPSTWSAVSGGQLTKVGTWSATVSDTGAAGHFRLYDSGLTTCFMQGPVTKAIRKTTNASTGVNGNVLTFASTTGIVAGDAVDGAGIPLGTYVMPGGVTSTTVTISAACPSGVANGTDVIFGVAGGGITLPEVEFTSLSDVLTVDVFTFVAPGA